MSNIVIGIIGVLSIIIFLVLSEKYGFSTQEQTISSLLLLIATLLLNVLSSILAFYNKLKEIHPFLSLPTEEQKEGYKMLKFLHELRKRKNSASAILAVDQFNNAKHALTLSSNNADFRVSDIVETNKTLLNSLSKGDTFDGVSMLVDPDIWKHDYGYLQLNINKSLQGVTIRRIFVFDNKEQFESMKDVMDKLSNVKTEVYWCMKNELNFRGFCQDFTIVKEHKIGVHIPVEQVNPTVIVSSSHEQITSLQSQFSKLLDSALKYEKKSR